MKESVQLSCLPGVKGFAFNPGADELWPGAGTGGDGDEASRGGTVQPRALRKRLVVDCDMLKRNTDMPQKMRTVRFKELQRQDHSSNCRQTSIMAMVPLAVSWDKPCSEGGGIVALVTAPTVDAPRKKRPG